MNLFNMMGGLFDTGIEALKSNDTFKWLAPIATFLDSLLIPLTIIIAVAGAIWVIILGVQLARAESADKAQESKKRLINVAVALVAVIVFVWLLTWFAANITTIFGTKAISDVSAFRIFL